MHQSTEGLLLHALEGIQRLTFPTLAAVGCYFQLAHGFAVPFPLSVLALPFDLAEFVLQWLVVAAGDGASPLDATLADPGPR